MRNAILWRRLLGCALVALATCVALAASCTEGRGPDPRTGRRVRDPWAVICAPAPAGKVAPATVIDADVGSGSDAMTVVDADVGSGSDAMTVVDADVGSGSDAMTVVDADVGSGSDAGMTVVDADLGSGSDAGMAVVDADVGSGSDAGMTGSDGGMDCKGIDIFETMISYVPLGSGSATVDNLVSGFVDTLVQATISTPDFEFTTAGCAPQLCDFAAMPKPLPTRLDMRCAASDGLPHTATLTARGAQGSADVDFATLDCVSASAPLIDVSPSPLDFGDVRVGTPSIRSLTVRNNGTAMLVFSIAPSTAPEWTFSACVSPAQCMVPPGGGSMLVDVQFLPTTYGVSATTIAFTSNAGSPSVGAGGNGLGSYIMVTEPADLDLDFGTIPRNSNASRPIAAAAVGNFEVSLDATDPGAPFSLDQTHLVLVPGVPQQLTASCGSPTATGPRSKTIALGSPDAYGPALPSIAVHCEVANTQISVAPNQFDFGEVRKGTAAPVLTFTIGNPGPVPAMIGAVDLAGAPAPLSMTLDDGGGFPRPLPVGGTITGRLSLVTGEDLDLAQAAPKLQVAVDGELLMFPVTGKVTTPAAYVSPEKLDLGTVCIGSGLSTTVSLINSGTARLLMQPPQIDSPAFALQLQSPPSYPAPLLAGTMATVGVAPVAQTPGELAGKLTWSVDVPMVFEVPVSLTLIETGTAISPASLDFSTVKVREISPRYMVTLQNCSLSPVMVTVDGVTSTRGGIAAWKTEPSLDARTLAPQDKLTISVAFAPLRRGHHVAQLRVSVDGERHFVTLQGDGIDLDFKLTSFYACGCTTPRARTGWPIAVAIALVMLRRRRRPLR